jgi:imidazolonepropionase
VEASASSPLGAVQTTYVNARIFNTSGNATDGIGYISAREGRITHVGQGGPVSPPTGDRVIDVGGRLVTPALIDAHTHLIFAGDRSAEFDRRVRGETYASISASGGGIASTVRATRQASDAELLELAVQRAATLHAEGVRTIEIKSGYGLTLQHELRSLRIARAVASHVPVRIVTTLLAAHAVPPEFKGNPDAWVTEICDHIIPAAAASGVADAVDVFCESIGFSLAQTERVFEAALRAGLPIKGHTEQLTHSGGSALAARMGARSVDHVEYLNEDDILELARHGTVAMLLPLPFVHIQETQKPPVQSLRRAAVPMAVATDFNPGTSPVLSLRLAMNLACSVFGLFSDESIAGVTTHAARALGLQNSVGEIKDGLLAELLVWPNDMTAEQLTSAYLPHLKPMDLLSLETAAPITVWSGRVDAADGPEAMRWHQKVTVERPESADSPIALLGFKCHAGVARNLGRTGAADGPDAIRRALANLAWHVSATVFDAGNVDCQDDELERAQSDYAAHVTSLVSTGSRVLGLGGGHEIAWASWKGLFDAAPTESIGIINLDAHFDLRNPSPRATSGTAFSQIAAACEHANQPFSYLVLGISEPGNTAALLQRARTLGVHWRTDEELRRATADDLSTLLHQFLNRHERIYLTLDLDVLPSDTAPGVSAPATLGVPFDIIRDIAFSVAASGKLSVVDIAELNPRFDLDQRTARLAARFIADLCSRWSPRPPGTMHSSQTEAV